MQAVATKARGATDATRLARGAAEIAHPLATRPTFMYFDETRAVAPLHMPVRVDGDLPETYPSGV